MGWRNTIILHKYFHIGNNIFQKSDSYCIKEQPFHYLRLIFNHYLIIIIFLYIMLNQEKVDKLQILQNRFLRIVYYGMDMTSDEMCQNMGKGKLEERRDLHLCGFMYKRSKCEEYIDDRKLPSRQFDKMVMKVPELALTKSFDIPGFKRSKL